MFALHRSFPQTLLVTVAVAAPSLVLAAPGFVLAHQADSSAPGTAGAEAAAEQARVAQREAAFAELLTGSKLVGSFTQSDKPGEAPQEDSYSITRVSKAEGDEWLFEASIEFGGRNIPIGLKLPVHWAGDTPVISVTDMSFPMLGKYSARVLFHDDQYVGVWSGSKHGGQMWGRVERAQSAEQASTNWPSFRGAAASGVADGAPVPTEWDVEAGTNIRWQVEVPGMAHSSPVVWGERLFITTAVRKDGGEQELTTGLFGDILPVNEDGEYRFELHCIDKASGETLWTRVCWEGVPSVKRHTKGSHAACSPATDGERVLAFFGGEGLYCYDLDGEPLWQRDLGPMDSGFYMVPPAQWGFGSSPILHEDLAIVQCDQQKGSFLAALDADTGEDRWRTDREEVPTWSTPTVLVQDGRSQVICNGYKQAGGYDLRTGERLWSVASGGDIPVPTPIVSQDLIFLTNAHGKKAPILAIDASATGELPLEAADEPFMAWSYMRRGNYMQTPLAYGDAIYFCTDAGIMSCFETKTGEERYRERLGEGRTGFTSSPVAANGHLYYASEEGDVHVVKTGEFEVVAVNALGEQCMATPAISAGVIYYRTRKHLIAVGF